MAIVRRHTGYGWLSPEGKYTSLPGKDHVVWWKENFPETVVGLDYSMPSQINDEALKRGWARVSSDHPSTVYLDVRQMVGKTKASVIEFVASLPAETVVRIWENPELFGDDISANEYWNGTVAGFLALGESQVSESPDHVYDDDRHLTWQDDGAFPFAFIGGKLHIGDEGSSHYNSVLPRGADDYGDFTGRIWVEDMVMSFWQRPPLSSVQAFLDALKKSDLPIHSLPRWRVDLRDEGLMSVRDYLKTFKTSVGPEADIAQQHTVSPVKKAPRSVPRGVGSMKAVAPGMVPAQARALRTVGDSVSHMVDRMLEGAQVSEGRFHLGVTVLPRKLSGEKLTESSLVLAEQMEMLNPEIWESGDQEGQEHLDPEVREHLQEIGREFQATLEMPTLVVKDMLLLGSMAGFNWTKSSDIDLHLLVDPKSYETCDVDAKEYFLAKQSLWNNNHEIEIYGHTVELYVQNSDEVNASNGVYSLEQDKWIRFPEKIVPEHTPEDPAVRAKVGKLAHEIDQLVQGDGTPEEVDRLKEKLRKMRQSGLDSHGEFSVENLAYKSLRNSGHLDRLGQHKIDAMDQSLSLE